MKLARVLTADGRVVPVLIQGDSLRTLAGVSTLSEILHADDPKAAAELAAASGDTFAAGDVAFLHPVDRQEVWAAGVTYKRSKIAREEESAGAAQFYDKVYTAPRPELFLKATPSRIVDPGKPIRVRADSRWDVPEPEFTLVVSPAGCIVGCTVGNDVSSRDIEGENPLYLPQAKIYRGSCSLGPVVTLLEAMPPLADVRIQLVIERQGHEGFQGTTTLAMMARTPEELVSWLFKENEFPEGVLLLTGTGIVPPDSFTLTSGDVVRITIDGIGTLTNPVA